MQGYRRNLFEFNMPAVIQTPGAEFEPCRPGARLYRLDQLRNPRGDPAEESSLFDRQFVQVPNECQIPVHLYSMPQAGMHRQARTRLTVSPAACAPRLYTYGAESPRPHRRCR